MKKRQTQYTLIGKLLARKIGTTPYEITLVSGTVCPHKRMSDLKAKGWKIERREVPGAAYGRYFGTAPAKA